MEFGGHQVLLGGIDFNNNNTMVIVKYYVLYFTLLISIVRVADRNSF